MARDSVQLDEDWLDRTGWDKEELEYMEVAKMGQG